MSHSRFCLDAHSSLAFLYLDIAKPKCRIDSAFAFLPSFISFNGASINSNSITTTIKKCLIEKQKPKDMQAHKKKKNRHSTTRPARLRNNKCLLAMRDLFCYKMTFTVIITQYFALNLWDVDCRQIFLQFSTRFVDTTQS